MEDLRIEFKFKNAALLKQLRAKFGDEATMVSIAEAMNVPYVSLLGLLALRMSPFVSRTNNGGKEIEGIIYGKTPMKIADYLLTEPAELFPMSLYNLKLPNKYYKDFESVQILSLQEAAAQKLLPPEESYDMNRVELRNDLNYALSTLTAREEKILQMRFGLDGGPEMTLEEVGNHFGVQRERIRQIEKKAFRKLRYPAQSNHLRAYIDPDYLPILNAEESLSEEENTP